LRLNKDLSGQALIRSRVHRIERYSACCSSRAVAKGCRANRNTLTHTGPDWAPFCVTAHKLSASRQCRDKMDGDERSHGRFEDDELAGFGDDGNSFDVLECDRNQYDAVTTFAAVEHSR